MSESRTPQPELRFEEPERWLPIEDFEGYYEVSDLGRVRSLDRLVDGRSRAGRPFKAQRRGCIVKLHLAALGRRGNYLAAVLSREGVKVRRMVHQLVLEAFVGPRPEGMEACHGPGGSLDNRAVNLSWNTHVHNLGPDRVRDGTHRRGERGARRFTAADVTSMRQRAAAGERGKDLAREFGVRTETINAILAGTRWCWDGSPSLVRPPRRPKLTDADVARIRERYAAGGVRYIDLAAEYGVTFGRIGQIVQQGRRMRSSSAPTRLPR